MTYSLSKDVNIVVYPEGIRPNTAADFVEDRDYILDQMDFYEVDNRYALHRAFRKSLTANLFLSPHGTYILNILRILCY